jgi:hypothetical protein
LRTGDSLSNRKEVGSMFGNGLNEESRNVIRDMVRNRAHWEDVANRVDYLVQNDGWDSDKNEAFVHELATAGYVAAARRLAKHTNNWLLAQSI